MRATMAIGLLMATVCDGAVFGQGPALRVRPVQVVSWDEAPAEIAFFTPFPMMRGKPGFQITYLVEGNDIVGINSLAIDSIKAPDGADISQYRNGNLAYSVGPNSPKAADDGSWCCFSLVVNQNQFGKVERLAIRGTVTVLVSAKREERQIDLKGGDETEKKIGPFSLRLRDSLPYSPPGFPQSGHGGGPQPSRPVATFAAPPGARSSPPTPVFPGPGPTMPARPGTIFGPRYLNLTITGPVASLIHARFRAGNDELQGPPIFQMGQQIRLAGAPNYLPWDNKSRTFQVPVAKGAQVNLTLSYWADMHEVKVPLGP